MKDKVRQVVIVALSALAVSAVLSLGIDRLVNSPFRPSMPAKPPLDPAVYPSVLFFGTVVMVFGFFVENGALASLIFFVATCLVVGAFGFAWTFDYESWEIFLGLFFFFSTVFAIIAKKIE